ncbi:MAG: hypothetical protein QM490_04910 [Candidatus Gracilibacteria bacterium]
MIKINKKDSIIDIIIKINNCKQKEVVLDFPFGHPIIHNYTSLKILKNKSGKKDLIIVTSDKTAKKIGKKLGIKYSKIGQADLLEYNYTFLEYSKYLFKRYIKEFFQLFSDNTPNIIFDYHKKYASGNSKIGFFMLGLVASILLFIFIFYFAVNKTYIHITPEITIKTRAENFIFREAQKDEITDNNIIKLNKISELIYLTDTFGTSGINEGTLKRSKGKVTFFNELNEDVALLKNTRVQTDDGIIFTADTDIIIPKATLSLSGTIQPGTTNINITSKIYDNEGKIVGDRGNINIGTLLLIPGLKTNRDKIYAKTIGEIKGGENIFTKQLTQVDIDNASDLLESKLRQQALNELKKQILENNKNNNITYEILGVNNILEYSDFKIIGKEKLKVGENIENFELSGTIKITSFTYNTEKVLNQLSNTVKGSLLKNIEKILFINNESLRISNIMNRQENPLEIKATAQVEAFFAHNFLNEKNNYIEKLKNTIGGINKNEALKILLNNPNISDVKIEIRPFFINTISKITDNIIIKVVEK